MDRSKLVRTLRKLSGAQWTAFAKFLRSPYYNQQESVVVLATYLKSCSQNWQAGRLQREVVFRACYPATEFDWQQLKDTASALLKLLRQFLVVEEIRGNPELEHSLVIIGAMKNNMNEVWERQLRRFEEAQGEALDLDPMHLQLLEKYKNHTLRSRQRSQAYQTLERQVRGLDHWYWKERLRLTAEAISIARVLRQEVENEILMPLADVPINCTDRPGIAPYYLILQLLRAPYPDSSVLFRQLLQMLEKNHFSGNSEQEVYSFHVYGLNYCTARINGGDASYYAPLFSIYELLVRYGRLIQEGQLSQWTFLNVVAAACNLRKYKWAQGFIEQYHLSISAGHRRNAFHYCSALLSFYQTQYDIAIEHLLQVSGSEDPYYDLNGRILQVRVFFEKQEWLLLESLLERLRIYLMRNKALTPRRRTEVRHFLRKVRKLAALIQSSKKQDAALARFIVSLKDSSAILHRSWLIDIANREHSHHLRERE